MPMVDGFGPASAALELVFRHRCQLLPLRRLVLGDAEIGELRRGRLGRPRRATVRPGSAAPRDFSIEASSWQPLRSARSLISKARAGSRRQIPTAGSCRDRDRDLPIGSHTGPARHCTNTAPAQVAVWPAARLARHQRSRMSRLVSVPCRSTGYHNCEGRTGSIARERPRTGRRRPPGSPAPRHNR
jgi:hypothetical protein